MHSLQSVVGSLRRRLDVVVLVVREPVAEPLVVQPLLPKAEVEHGECAITGDFLVHGQELWQSEEKRGSKICPEKSWLQNSLVSELLSREGGVGFQKDESAAPSRKTRVRSFPHDCIRPAKEPTVMIQEFDLVG